MKTILATLFFPVLAFSAEPLVNCDISTQATCKDCQKRIPASCENHNYGGFLDSQLKPQKIQWIVSNKKNGTETVTLAENKSVTLLDLHKSKNPKSLAGKMKVKVSADETVQLGQIQIPASTRLYKAKSGTDIAAQMKSVDQARMMASTDTKEIATGVRRAQSQKAKAQGK